jgi:phage tail protein X
MSRYKHTSLRREDGNLIRQSTVYIIPPESPNDYYVISSVGDRFDILASEYYQDSSLWYIIAAANPHIAKDSIIIPNGAQIRIPLPLSKVLTTIENKNRIR